MDRTQPVGITLSRETRAPHTAIAGRAKLPGLNVERALKGGQLQASTRRYQGREMWSERLSIENSQYSPLYITVSGEGCQNLRAAARDMEVA